MQRGMDSKSEEDRSSSFLYATIHYLELVGRCEEIGGKDSTQNIQPKESEPHGFLSA